MPITIKPTQLKYKDPSTSQYVSVVAAAEGGSSNIDVQINGTSILSNGIANIPKATYQNAGVVKTSTDYGTNMRDAPNDDTLMLVKASSDNIKNGNSQYKPVVPYNQHESVFYGLAKAAGTDMSSSSNAVGVYTDAAKTAIQNMLAVSSSNNPVFTGAFSQNRKSNTTIGTKSFSSGDNCEASAEDSHAEGRYTVASGHYSHAEGNYTTASGMASHAAGTVTIANHASQYTFGEYNVEDSSSASALSRGNYVEIVGNGTASNAQSNARALDWSGNEYLNGYIYVGCGNNSANGTRIPHDIQINSTSIVSNGVANIPIGSTTTPGVFIRGSGLYQDGAKLGVNGSTSENIKGGTAGTFTPVSKQHEATFYGLAKAAGDSTQSASSNAVGVYTNNAKTAIQNMLSIPSSNDPVFTGSFSQNRKANTTVGFVSAVIGDDNSAEGVGAIAMGYNNRAYVQGSIALGTNNIIYGDGAVAIGYKNIAQYQSTFVFGQYNAIDTITDWASNVEYDVGDLVYNNAYVLKCLTAHTSGSTIDYSNWAMTINNLFTLGNGNGENPRSNALAVNFDGDLRIKGNLYVNCNADSSGGIRIPHDIQINGTSVVSNGIATVPIASDATFGVIKTREFTDGFKFDSNNNFQLAGPTDTQIKAGETNFRAITPYVQHTSVFYGLAKAAGDTTQASSSNTVGTYTDAAKTAIQNMLAVAPTSNPVFTDSLSMGRLENSTVGYNSVVLGYENSAISTGSISIGYQSIAAQELAVAEGYGIVANSFASHVFGRFNAYDGYDRDPWVAGTSYALDDIVVKDYKVYTCQQANSDTEWDESKWYNATQTSLLQVGYGADDSYRRNVLNLDVSGNLFLGGDVYVHSNLTCTSGNKVATVAQLPTVMTGATASENGTSGLVPTPTPNDMYKFLSGDGTYRSGGLPMVILSYGNSTWSDFINAYNNNVIVYCRASSNSNPATGSQTRMAFMAYVNNATSPTEVEFQYYRSVSSHTASQQGDQVFVYKLTSASKWTVTTREAMARIVAGTNMSSTYSNNVLTINGNYQSMTGASSSASGTSGLVPAPSAGDHEKFLKGDGTWAEAGETVYANTIDMSSSDSTKISEAIAEKVDKVTGKGLSTNDYTTADQTAVQTTLPNRITAIETAKGANGGYAELDSSGKVPSSQLPSYVDDVEEYPTLNDFPATGESGKIYVATSTNITYRWGGSEYVPIGSDLALGETSSTAYRGDRGKAAYDHATAKGSAYANGFYKITTNSEGHVTSASAVQKSDITDLGIPGNHQDISGKADKVSNATSGNFAGLDANGNLTDSGHKHSDYLTQHQDISGKVDKNQGVAHAGKALGINAQGMVEPVTFSGDDFTGATSSTAGTHGYVPAPAATDNTKYLKGDGTWTDVLPSVTSSDNGKSLEVINGEWTTGNEKIDKHFDVEKFEEKTWGETFAPGSSPVWTDGENIYYSSSTFHYILDKSTSTWSFKTWSGLTSFNGNYVWTDGENIYYSNSTTHYVLNKSTSTWSAKTWTGLTSFNGNYVWTDGENIYYSNSSNQYVLDKSTSTWSAKTWTGLTSFNCNSVWSDGENVYYSSGATQYVLNKSTSTWSAKTWTGLTSFNGLYIWTDGENIYYSSSTTQYVLNKSTSTWSTKTWTGLTKFDGNYVWTDGENIYYSSGAKQYVLDKSTSTWSAKTWNKSASFSGNSVWTDGENIYYSDNAAQYVLDKSTSTWSSKTWTGLTDFGGNSVWTDGENIYYSYSANQYVLNKSTSKWSKKTWTGLTKFDGQEIWSDGENVYYSDNANQYVLDKSTSTWSTKTWTGLTKFYGNRVWTDEENIYYSSGATQYVLDKSTSTWFFKTWTGLTSFYGNYVWTDGENIYYSDNANQYVLDKSTSTWSRKTWTGLTDFDGRQIWSNGENVYYSSGSSQYILRVINNQILLGRNGTFVPVSISDVVSSPVTMTGADGANAGTAGYVPAPAAGDQDKVLHGDGTWKTALNNNIIDHGRIELSSLSKSTVVGSTTYYFDDFSFNKTFPSAPHLIMSTVNNAWPGAGDIGGNYFATNVTATGFRLISVYKIASYYMDWIAIGSNA